MSADKKSSQPNSSTGSTMLIVGTFLDTTWRMFVPVLLFTLIGYIIDTSFALLPVATIAGICLGMVSSGVLVRQQYMKLKSTDKE